MAHLQSDGAKVFSLWDNEGMTGYRKRPRVQIPTKPPGHSEMKSPRIPT